MGKMYRTANGKMIDMDMLALQNELIPAVGNMKVNARGDQVDSGGKIIKSRAELMQEYHKLNTMVPQEGAIPQKLEPDVTTDIVAEDEPDAS